MVNESNKKVEVKSGKFKREKVQAPPSKIAIRKLPPTFTEEDFKNAISPVPENNYFSFVPPDKGLGTQAFSRAYINFLNTEEIVSFRDRFDGYVFVDQKGNEFPALVEYAPFQKIPKSNHNKKDIRCGTIDEDPDYLAFLELLQNPETVNLPQIETLLEEIETAEREIRANNGILKVKTPLLEYIEQRNSERFRAGDRKRRKEFDRKKTREEEKRRKKEYIKEYRKRDDYYASKEERERERAKRREEDKLKWKERREEREKLKREKVAERFKNDEKSDSKNFADDSAETTKPSSQNIGKENLQREEKPKFPTQKSKRYSEVRKKEERERKKDNLKVKGNEEKKVEAPVIKEEEEEKVKKEEETVSTNVVEKEVEIINANETESSTKDEDFVEQTEVQNDKDYEQEETEETKCDKEENYGEEEEKYDENEDGDKDDKNNKDKDPRTERRIRNKDRPAMQLYRPGQARLKTRLKSNEEGAPIDGGDSSSSSASPVMGVNEEEKEKEERKSTEPPPDYSTKPTGKSYGAVKSGGYDRKYSKYRDSRSGGGGGGHHSHNYHYWDDRDNYSYNSRYKDDYEGGTRGGSVRGRKGYSYHQERESKNKWSNRARESESSQFKSMTFRRSTSQE